MSREHEHTNHDLLLPQTDPTLVVSLVYYCLMQIPIRTMFCQSRDSRYTTLSLLTLLSSHCKTRDDHLHKQYNMRV